MRDVPTAGLQDHLQPSLIDRLIDEEPERREENARSRTLTIKQLKSIVLRDLENLLNAFSFDRIEELADYPEVVTSVVNYGAPDVAGRLSSAGDARKMERSIRDAIERFEPRILKDTLRVRVIEDTSEKPDKSLLRFEIEGELWAEPAPLHLLLTSTVDRETGRAEIGDL